MYYITRPVAAQRPGDTYIAGDPTSMLLIAVSVSQPALLRYIIFYD